MPDSTDRRRQFVLTEDGIRYHRDIASVPDIIARANVDLIKRGDHRCSHIRCMPGFALHWLSGHLGRFREGQPGLDVELHRPTAALNFSAGYRY